MAMARDRWPSIQALLALFLLSLVRAANLSNRPSENCCHEGRVSRIEEFIPEGSFTLGSVISPVLRCILRPNYISEVKSASYFWSSNTQLLGRAATWFCKKFSECFHCLPRQQGSYSTTVEPEGKSLRTSSSSSPSPSTYTRKFSGSDGWMRQQGRKKMQRRRVFSSGGLRLTDRVTWIETDFASVRKLYIKAR